MQAQRAYGDCFEASDDLTFDQWRHAIIEHDEEWHAGRGAGPSTSADNQDAKRRVQALFDHHDTLATNMATGLTDAPAPPPRRAGCTGRSARHVAAPVAPP